MKRMKRTNKERERGSERLGQGRAEIRIIVLLTAWHACRAEPGFHISLSCTSPSPSPEPSSEFVTTETARATSKQETKTRDPSALHPPDQTDLPSRLPSVVNNQQQAKYAAQHPNRNLPIVTASPFLSHNLLFYTLHYFLILRLSVSYIFHFLPICTTTESLLPIGSSRDHPEVSVGRAIHCHCHLFPTPLLIEGGAARSHSPLFDRSLCPACPQPRQPSPTIHKKANLRHLATESCPDQTRPASPLSIAAKMVWHRTRPIQLFSRQYLSCTLQYNTLALPSPASSCCNTPHEDRPTDRKNGISCSADRQSVLRKSLKPATPH
ncbi:hypothetical protein BKA61DRAFT_28815 [Leptodontidium sp. MPI-SDFR-AT-0119]|nr:hypothetical protein BKA61DRAFT_28815 [Leptodontidium sp. MPI-SDFR-AT-0119]